MALQIATAGTGVVRDAHFVTPTGTSTPVRTLLLELQRTNVLPTSNALDTAAGVTITSNAGTAPDGTTTAQRCTRDSTDPRYLSHTATGFLPAASTAYTISRFFKYDGFAFTCSIENNSTEFDAAFRANFVINSDGTITAGSVSGAVTASGVEALSNGWYRCWVTFTSGATPSGTAGRYLCRLTGIAGTPSLLSWGGQMEAGFAPSSYIPTTGTAVSRNADVLYFSVPVLDPPREMTVYVRGVNVGSAQGFRTVVSVGNAGFTGARFLLTGNTSGNQFLVRHFNGTSDVLTTAGSGTVNMYDLTEWRGVLRADGAVQIGGSINGAAEIVGSASASLGMATAWSDTRLYLNSSGLGSNVGQFAYTHVCVALGQQTRAAMRTFAGVP